MGCLAQEFQLKLLLISYEYKYGQGQVSKRSNSRLVRKIMPRLSMSWSGQAGGHVYVYGDLLDGYGYRKLYCFDPPTDIGFIGIHEIDLGGKVAGISIPLDVQNPWAHLVNVHVRYRFAFQRRPLALPVDETVGVSIFFGFYNLPAALGVGEGFRMDAWLGTNFYFVPIQIRTHTFRHRVFQIFSFGCFKE